MAMQVTPGSIVSDGHVIMTGKIEGSVTLEDGTVVDVTPGFIEVPASQPEKAAEIADLIGQRYAAEGHPDDYEIDPDTGEKVPVEFVYNTPEQAAEILAEQGIDVNADPSAE